MNEKYSNVNLSIIHGLLFYQIEIKLLLTHFSLLWWLMFIVHLISTTLKVFLQCLETLGLTTFYQLNSYLFKDFENLSCLKFRKWVLFEVISITWIFYLISALKIGMVIVLSLVLMRYATECSLYAEYYLLGDSL